MGQYCHLQTGLMMTINADAQCSRITSRKQKYALCLPDKLVFFSKTNNFWWRYFKSTHPHLCDAAVRYRQDRVELMVPVHIGVELQRDAVEKCFSRLFKLCLCCKLILMAGSDVKRRTTDGQRKIVIVCVGPLVNWHPSWDLRHPVGDEITAGRDIFMFALRLIGCNLQPDEI